MALVKPPKLSEMLDLVLRDKLQLPPLSFSCEVFAPSPADLARHPVVRLLWGGRLFRFVIECQRVSSARAVSGAIAFLNYYSTPPELYPLVMVPYLPEERLAELLAQQVSGIDLCGNGVVVVPNELLVYRTGCPNRFRSEAEIKNVFRGDSSLVARAYLLVPEYASVQAAQREIEKRGGKLVLATVSKVCKSLEAMLIIERKRSKGTAARHLRLLQPDKLLDLLKANYVAPAVTKTVRGKTKLAPEIFRKELAARISERTRLVQTGFGSVAAYAVMATEPMQYFYCTDLDATIERLAGAFEPTDRFANVTFLETKEAAGYFDSRPGLVASPIQVYLELATGDKRSQETAEQLRRNILAPLTGARGEDS
ncbi:MAG TPA: hypothetical protein VMG10_26180 [Gemmataceae bacterium]|nr:hypothetical protein [Gemmataceae bacterium]